jgi:putative NIF3 family GTP cyclohydrolase 1 type 2
MRFTRRQFVTTSLALGTTSFLGFPLKATSENPTIQQVMDVVLKQVPGAPFSQTVDTIKSGKTDQKVTGIVTTMFATIEVIRKAIDLKANFIIAHEPTFYNHTDRTDWIENDPVYLFKKNLLEKNNIVVWRFHDYIHALRPDGVLTGFLETMGWERFYNAENPELIKVPAMTVSEVIVLAKQKLGIKYVKVVGDLNQPCERIGLLPGAWGGRPQINLQQKEKPDLMLCGEVAEWETSEYIRDARAMGERRSLIILGHALSEEPGMKWMASWLRPKISGVSVTHIASNEPFIWV